MNWKDWVLWLKIAVAALTAIVGEIEKQSQPIFLYAQQDGQAVPTFDPATIGLLLQLFSLIQTGLALWEAWRKRNPVPVPPPAPSPFPPAPPLIPALLVGLLLCGATAVAAPPKAKISGPDKAGVGDPLVFEAGPVEAGRFHWIVTPANGRLRLLGGNQIAVLGNQPGVWTLVLGVSTLEGLDLATHVVTVEGTPLPIPPTPPEPAPPPTPPTPTPTPPAPVPGPDRFSSVTNEVRVEAAKVGNPAQGRLIAEALERIAGKIDRGEIAGTGAQIAVALIGNTTAPGVLIVELRNSLGLSAVNWLGFGNWLLSIKTKALYESGMLATSADWSLYLRAVAKGLT